MRRELAGPGVPSDSNRLRPDSLTGEQKIEHAPQYALGRIVLAEQVERIAGTSIECILNHVAVRRADHDPAGILAFEEDTPVCRDGVEHHRAVGGHDDLKVVA